MYLMQYSFIAGKKFLWLVKKLLTHQAQLAKSCECWHGMFILFLP